MTSEMERQSHDLSPTTGDRNFCVINGIYSHSLPIAGMSVGEARREFQELIGIDTESMPVVNGIQVDDDTVLREGQVLHFIRPAGEMG